jgi:hypothetical protein
MEKNKVILVVREFDPKKDIPVVEDIETRCEVGPTGQMSLFTNLLGDPISRIRHSPSFLMLVLNSFHFIFKIGFFFFFVYLKIFG